MILYDKSGMFLGMGNQELSLLGYEDIEEFRNYHNDVADLFINKPGYIFKFKNFSWIDYALHSGTPNRRVLVRTKGGREIDSALLIHEIYLTQEAFGTTICYGVEFSNAPFKELSNASSQNSTPNTFETPVSYEASTPFVAEDAPSTLMDAFTYDTPVETISFSSEPLSLEEDFSAPISFSPSAETSDFKLKFDSSILDEPPIVKESLLTKEYKTIDDIKEEDFSLKLGLETYPDDENEDLRNDTNLLIEKPRAHTALSDAEEASLFDFSLSADALGLDINTLAILIEEYIEELETKIKLIATSLDSSDHTLVENEISKLKSVALHLHIMPLYLALGHLETRLVDDTHEAILHQLLCVQNIIADLKDSLK